MEKFIKILSSETRGGGTRVSALVNAKFWYEKGEDPPTSSLIWLDSESFKEVFQKGHPEDYESFKQDPMLYTLWNYMV